MINKPIEKDDHRWFIWTIVFLLVSGVSLTSYIMITDIEYTSQEEQAVFVKHPPK